MGDSLFSIGTLKKHPAVSKKNIFVAFDLALEKIKTKEKWYFEYFDREKKKMKMSNWFVETYQSLYNQKSCTVTIVSKMQLII